MDETNYVLEAHEKMKNNTCLAGSFYGEEFKGADGHIVWHLFDGYAVEITSEMIAIYKDENGKLAECIYHWHPCDEDLYDEICKLGTKGNVTVIQKGWIRDSRIFSGPRDACPIKRKWLFGKYIYLYAD